MMSLEQSDKQNSVSGVIRTILRHWNKVINRTVCVCGVIRTILRHWNSDHRTVCVMSLEQNDVTGTK